MTEEDLDWFEKNWSRGKTGRKAADHNRTWKLSDIGWWDWDYYGHKYSDMNCWKSHRKTQYRVKKVHKKKRRKLAQKEHWRKKKSFHSWSYRNTLPKHRPEYHRWEEVCGAISFLEKLKIGDLLKKPDDRINMFYRVFEIDYDDWGDDWALYIRCASYTSHKRYNDYEDGAYCIYEWTKYDYRHFLDNNYGRFYRKIYSEDDLRRFKGL